MAVDWHGDELVARVRDAAMAAVFEGATIIDQKAVDLIMNGPKTGVIYKRGDGFHQASAAGEAPANDTGALVNRRRIDLLPERVAARVVFSAEHALYLQFGTEHMAPRPFADLAVNATRDQVIASVRARIRGAVGG